MRLLRGATLVLQGCVSLAGELCSEVPPISKATMTDAQSQSAFLYDIHHLFSQRTCYLK